MNEWRVGSSDGGVVPAVWRGILKQMRHKRWLLGLLARRGAHICARLLSALKRLQDLPPRASRSLRAQARRRLATALLGAVLLFGLGHVPPAQAATITVDGACTLADAITAANDDAATNGCAAGSGPDTIELQTDVTLSTALPPITSDIHLNANGHTIDGAGVVTHVLHVTAGALTLNEAIITGGNATVDSGGGVFNYGGAVTVNNSTITANSASYGGGGVANFSGEMWINNSTITANSADGGGGIANLDNITINNSTITGNTGHYSGGGLYLADAGLSTLNRSIISGNSATYYGDEIAVSTRFVTVAADNFNVFGFGGDAGAHNFTPGASDIVPSGGLTSLLDTTLAANGGLTPTHALVAGSPAIDRAPDAGCAAPPLNGLDQRGFARNADGNSSPSSNECDLGAYEFASGPTAVSLSAMHTHSAARGGPLAAIAALLLAVGTAGYSLYNRVIPPRQPRTASHDGAQGSIAGKT